MKPCVLNLLPSGRGFMAAWWVLDIRCGVLSAHLAAARLVASPVSCKAWRG